MSCNIISNKAFKKIKSGSICLSRELESGFLNLPLSFLEESEYRDFINLIEVANSKISSKNISLTHLENRLDSTSCIIQVVYKPDNYKGFNIPLFYIDITNKTIVEVITLKEVPETVGNVYSLMGENIIDKMQIKRSIAENKENLKNIKPYTFKRIRENSQGSTLTFLSSLFFRFNGYKEIFLKNLKVETRKLEEELNAIEVKCNQSEQTIREFNKDLPALRWGLTQSILSISDEFDYKIVGIEKYLEVNKISKSYCRLKLEYN